MTAGVSSSLQPGRDLPPTAGWLFAPRAATAPLPGEADHRPLGREPETSGEDPAGAGELCIAGQGRGSAALLGGRERPENQDKTQSRRQEAGQGQMLQDLTVPGAFPPHLKAQVLSSHFPPCKRWDPRDAAGTATPNTMVVRRTRENRSGSTRQSIWQKKKIP